jgi:fumarate reductase subunit D
MAAVAMGGERVELDPREIVPVRLRLSWGAIFGGMFVALGVWLMLLTLGLAVGLGAVDPNNLSSARNAATGTGVWSVIALVLSLFAGGMVSARTAGILDRPTGALHGAVLWGFTTLAGAFVLSFALRAGIVTAANVGSEVMNDVARETDTLTQRQSGQGQIERSMRSAIDATRTAMWWTFFTQLLGLGASVAGASIAVGRKQRRVVAPPVSVPLATTQEAHSVP